MSEQNKQNMSEEDYLKQHLSGVNNTQEQKQTFSQEKNKSEPSNDKTEKVEELNYFHFSVDQMPCGDFYPKGTLIMVRPAMVKEIQAYSMVDDNNFQDIVEKMNNMLKSCIRVKYPDGNVKSYLDVKDQDRLFLIFSIRELTFQEGNELSVNTESESGEKVNIPLKREHFVFHKREKKLDKFFDNETRSYKFKLKNKTQFEVAPPNIGIQKSFTEYIIKENSKGKEPNLAFLKIIPFLLNGKNSISYEGINKKLEEFEKMDDVSFQFLNSAISKLTFGIKELHAVSSDGEEVTAEMEFPRGASGIFVLHDAFEEYIED